MESFLYWISVAVILVTCLSALDLFFGMRRMKRLSEHEPMARGDVPKVSLVVPACNEEENIEQAITSQLRQQYENLQVIAINDRSTDATGTILEGLKEKYPQLEVVHVDSLPQGWMGKAHALQLGADKASGKYLLFTDGDIIMEESTISRAVRYVEEEGLDHLALLFRNISPGWLLNSLILESGAGLIQALRPWRARNSEKSFVGVGAFNLIRKSAYLAVGKHTEIKMHPIDDIMIGKKLKRGGFSQECLLGVDLVTVPWYASIREMIDGLMKNILAIINYRFFLLPPIVLVLFFVNILPYWGILLTSGSTQLIFGGVVAVKLVAFFTGTRLLGISSWCALGTVFTPYITIFIMVRAAWFNLRDNGIIWRGTHYPLAVLRKNEPLFP